MLAGASAPARASTVTADWKATAGGLGAAVKAGELDPDTAAAYRAQTIAALGVIQQIPPGRARDLQFVLHEVAAQKKRYDGARALALFSMLSVNATYLASHPLPRGKLDISDGDGVVYRYFPRQGFQFHPLASFGALNAAVAAQDAARAATMIDALSARGEPGPGGSLRFEYWFPFGRGKAPWVSGMAQAVAAQALARAANLVDPTLLDSARAAYAAIPRGLVQQLPSGPWIRLYSFDKLVVLNAQLQAALSLAEYAELAVDPGAQQLADGLLATAAALLPRFDTGFWSYYSLDGDEATLDYHTYVVQLLTKLGERTGDPAWTDAAARFGDDLVTPPELTPAQPAPLSLYPVPADGFRDTVKVPLWLSKVSWVTVRFGEATTTSLVGHGYHVLRFSPRGRLHPGVYPGTVTATDLAGNVTRADLPELTVDWDTEAPVLDATLSGRVLTWQADDPGTPWLKLTLVLRSSTGTRWVRLGRRPLGGQLTLTPPPGTWDAALVGANSAHKQTRIALGPLS
jgi:hypothetical protein